MLHIPPFLHGNIVIHLLTDSFINSDKLYLHDEIASFEIVNEVNIFFIVCAIFSQGFLGTRNGFFRVKNYSKHLHFKNL